MNLQILDSRTSQDSSSFSLCFFLLAKCYWIERFEWRRQGYLGLHSVLATIKICITNYGPSLKEEIHLDLYGEVILYTQVSCSYAIIIKLVSTQMSYRISILDQEKWIDWSTFPPRIGNIVCADGKRLRKLYKQQKKIPGYKSLIESNVTIFGTIDGK
jgi:hypothetical protein